MLSFSYPYILLGIIVSLLIVFVLYSKGSRKVYFGAYEDLKKVYTHNAFYYKIYFLLVFVILTCFLFIIARPVLLNQTQVIEKNGHDIEIVLDVSLSMIAKDIQPSRLEVAKKVINDFVGELQSDRVGMVVFAGKPFQSLPLNYDYNIVKKIVSRLNENIINQQVVQLQGTAIGDALLLAADNLKKGGKKQGVIILLTDGTANKGLDPRTAVEYIKQNYQMDIKIYTIGVGSGEPTTIVLPSIFGNQVIEIQGIDQETLMFIADKTGGNYYLASSQAAFKKAFEDIAKLEKTPIKIKNKTTSRDLYMYIIYVLNFSILIFLYISYKKRI